MKWTSTQQSVIDTRNKNILVSAAAGSGKTAVLVERIIQRIMDEKDPVDVDKILVVTFTNAAAAEMKERVRKALDKAVLADPKNSRLRTQATLVHTAQIRTIDSFCS
ncbi:MAG: UvrD-helicase domain-containing protein, partial [Pseudobutyrivibrio sp.]|nr:UvrD-helicase domain-containing protein [Pseudobutyrivibrio sp.]